MLYLIAIFLLLCFLQLLLVIHFKKPAFIAHRLKIKVKKQSFRTVIFCLIFLLYILLFFQLKDLQTYRPIPLIPVHSTATITNGHTSYMKIGYREAADLQNFYFLYSAPDKSEETLEKLATQIRKDQCTKLCIVNFYDDMQAYQLDMERINITVTRLMEEWNTKNYVYVAEHYLGYSGPNANDSFAYYPFKDWYFKQSQKQEAK